MVDLYIKSLTVLFFLALIGREIVFTCSMGANGTIGVNFCYFSTNSSLNNLCNVI